MTDWNRTLSLLVALSWLGLSLLQRAPGFLLWEVACLVMPMAAIWYGDELGVLLKLPGRVVRVVGWAILLWHTYAQLIL